MPTADFARRVGALPLASLGFLGADYPVPNEHIITPMSHCAIGDDLNGVSTALDFASTTWPSANRAIAYPFVIAHPFLIRKVFWLNGATALGTDDATVGVYTEAGALVVASATTPASGSSLTQEVDITDTLLRPGRYWCAMAVDGTGSSFFAHAPATNLLHRVVGIAMQASAFPLPSTFTPAVQASAYLPMFGISARVLAS